MKQMKNLSKKLTFKYTDEEKDIITFSSEGEWNSLLETFDGKSVLKITLEIRKEKKKIIPNADSFMKGVNGKKNEELKDQYEKSDHPWKNFHHNRCEWRKNREGNEDSSFWKNWKEKKVIEIENLKKR